MNGALFRQICIASISIMASVANAAAISLTMDGTASATKLGYTTGQAVSFTFVLNDYAPATVRTTPVSACCSGGLRWIQDFATEPHLWSAVSGTGLTGAWLPTGDTSSLWINIRTPPGSSETLQFEGANSAGSPSSGLFISGFEVSGFQFSSSFLGLDAVTSFAPGAAFGPVAPDPTDLLTSMVGTYLVDPSFASLNRIDVRTPLGSDRINFAMNRLTIATATAPQPSTPLLLCLGVAVLLFARTAADKREDRCADNSKQV